MMEFQVATILVLIVTSRNIILAADSCKTIIDSDSIKKAGTMDKIYQTQDYYYAVSGMDSSEDGSFRIQRIMHHILNNFSDVKQAIKNMIAVLPQALKSFFQNLQMNSSPVFSHFQKYSASGGEIFIVKRAGAAPSAHLLEYKIIDKSADIKVVLNTWHIDTAKIQSKTECFWRVAGNASFLNRLAISEQEIAENPAVYARQIIEEGIRMYPEFVSQPVNILEVTETETRWIEKSATAPNRIVLF